MERRIYALRLSYDGAAFRGWQRQPAGVTVQSAVEDALASLLGEQVRVHGAARTDAGVHADAQVASFAVSRAVLRSDLLGLPLGNSAGVEAAVPAPPSFHARASATGKNAAIHAPT